MFAATLAPSRSPAPDRLVRSSILRVNTDPTRPESPRKGISGEGTSREGGSPDGGPQVIPPDSSETMAGAVAARMDQTSFTRLLSRVSAGDRADLNRLLEVVYDELRRLAQVHLRQERADHTLAATALVHEAYIRLVDQREVAWQDRAHFFAAASRVIRRILVDHARAHNALKRGGDRDRVDLSGIDHAAGAQSVDLLDLEEALHRLAEIDERQARIVELRYFGGLTVEQIAEVLDLGPRTVDRDWRCARTWLFSELGPDGGSDQVGRSGRHSS